MTAIDDLLASLPSGEIAVRDARVGAFWTVVWTDQGAGLASTQRDARTPHGRSLIRWAGDLTAHSAGELAGLLRSESPMEAALGMASVNALLAPDLTGLPDINAIDEIKRRGEGRRVAIVGHFPFVPRLRGSVGHLDVLELDPGPDELPAGAAATVLPQAEVVAITGTALVNKTFEALMTHCRPDAFVLVIGPSAPLSPVLFDYGADLIAGTIVEDPYTALTVAGQGAIFRQMRGMRMATMTNEGS